MLTWERHILMEEQVNDEKCRRHAESCGILDVDRYMDAEEIYDCEDMPCWNGCPLRATCPAGGYAECERCNWWDMKEGCTYEKCE